MKQSTYDHISKHIDCLDVDVDNGVIKNRKVQINQHGYERVYLKDKAIFVHSIIAFIIWGSECIDKPINHIDGNKRNNKKNNLEVVTASENQKHAYRIGLQKPSPDNIRRVGSAHFRALLTEDEVIEIRYFLNLGARGVDIAKEYGVAPRTVTSIKLRTNWRHI